ncbi:MAG: hypothetical protein PHG67_06395 [Bacteroidales bacterium]|nr:hypothetical protein [Bacteroidales bacterium]
MKNCIFYLLFFFLSVVSLKCQNSIYLEELKPRNDSSIVFPVFAKSPSAGNINNELEKVLHKSFNLDSFESLDELLEVAIYKGLDSLTYLLFETDSTLSISLSVRIKRGVVVSGWTDFFTFSKRTGAQIDLDELFPDLDTGLLYTKLLDLQTKHIQTVRAEIIDKHNNGLIPEANYTVLLYLIDRHMLASFNESFLLDKETLVFKNGIILPSEFKKDIPIFFRVNINELFLK